MTVQTGVQTFLLATGRGHSFVHTSTIDTAPDIFTLTFSDQRVHAKKFREANLTLFTRLFIRPIDLLWPRLLTSRRLTSWATNRRLNGGLLNRRLTGWWRRLGNVPTLSRLRASLRWWHARWLRRM